MTRVVLFAGQGTQRTGMGAELFDRFPELVEQADEILGYSIRELCVGDPGGRLGRTRFSQPAIYVVNALARRAMDGPADVYLGHSLGEYNALEAAGVFDFATGLELVRERARLTDAVEGSMTVVMGLSAEAVEDVLNARDDLQASIAAFNGPANVVVAAPGDGGDVVAAMWGAGALRVRPLLISGPFHTRHMAGAAKAFGELLRRASARLHAPRIPVIANRHARPHESESLVVDLTEQITHPVLWSQSIEGLLGSGVHFHEAYGATLTTLTRQIQRHHSRIGGLR
ncbi:ACP S-malonyltransferase [Amycolatopsis palatopharyngis]|uniref:ACP S-malonyltransferase n=1 Tax=Amycolatopsis palatopharyngis TaxID=187982 RepID=UPI000E2259B9|nr:ACP S-malonyltransferase [Amycolatopsis palatopharyngis]